MLQFIQKDSKPQQEVVHGVVEWGRILRTPDLLVEDAHGKKNAVSRAVRRRRMIPSLEKET